MPEAEEGLLVFTDDWKDMPNRSCSVWWQFDWEMVLIIESSYDVVGASGGNLAALYLGPDACIGLRAMSVPFIPIASSGLIT